MTLITGKAKLGDLEVRTKIVRLVDLFHENVGLVPANIPRKASRDHSRKTYL